MDNLELLPTMSLVSFQSFMTKIKLYIRVVLGNKCAGPNNLKTAQNREIM
jgi:hypothetical protein